MQEIEERFVPLLCLTIQSVICEPVVSAMTHDDSYVLDLGGSGVVLDLGGIEVN